MQQQALDRRVASRAFDAKCKIRVSSYALGAFLIFSPRVLFLKFNDPRRGRVKHVKYEFFLYQRVQARTVCCC